jgi:methionyl-tRNA synthetase
MSKSIGNVIKPLDLANKYGADSLRYYLMRNMVLGQDASYTYESFVERYNADLANDYGNLVNRILILIHKYFDSKIPENYKYSDLDLELIAKAKQLTIQIIENYNNFKLHEALKINIDLFRNLNKYLEIKSPWKTIKNPKEKKDTSSTLYIAAEILRIGTVLISPVMPGKAVELFKYFNLKTNLYDYSFGHLKTGHEISKPKNMFPKIEL